MLGASALVAAGRADAQSGALVLRAGEATTPLGDAALVSPAFNGLGSGPLLELKRDAAFLLKIENTLDFPFYFRPQGLRGKAIQGNDTPLAPGETRAITITPPDAGTFVYRAGAESGPHVTRTILLAGPLIVTADQPRIADRELLLAVNTIFVPDSDDSKPPRRIVTANGSRGIKLAARPEERLRLRFVNLAQEAVNGIRLPKGTNVVAIDGQPCEPFPPFDDVMFLPPLGRADILLGIPREAATLTITDAIDTKQALATITVDGDAMPERFLAQELPENPLLPKEIALQSAARASWKPGEAAKDPLVGVNSGGSVMLTFENTATPHALVLDGLTARLLDAMDDGWKGWWHDTLIVHANETARLALIAPEPGRYAIDTIPLEGNGAPTRSFIDVS